jgi:acyl carrier protein
MKKQPTLGVISRDEIQAGIEKVIKKVMKVDQVKENDNLRSDLQVDSLDVCELSMNIEKHFSIALLDDDIEKFQDMTVGEIIDLLYSKY